MNNDKGLVTNIPSSFDASDGTNKVQSLQDKTGASAKQIRRAIEQVGFDRDKVEQYLLQQRKQGE